jgi:hypothetical protein
MELDKVFGENLLDPKLPEMIPSHGKDKEMLVC